MLAWLEAQHHAAENAACGSAAATPSTNGRGERPAGHWQLTLFGGEEHPLLDEIRAADLNDLTPLEALQLLHEWQSRLAEDAARVGDSSPPG